MTKEMESLYAERDALRAKLNTLNVKDNYDEMENVVNSIADVDKRIDMQEKVEKVATSNMSVVSVTETEKPKFKTFAEQLRAIKNAAVSKGANIDPRLIKDEIKGVNTQTDADGGYAIQSDFIGNILDRAFVRSEIVNRCRQYPVSANSNRANWVEADDSDDATKEGIVVAGGVFVKWLDEGERLPDSKPKFLAREEKLGKLGGFAYVTEEALEDIPFMAEYLEDSFSDAVAGMITDGILNGKGDVLGTARQPVGIFTSDAVVAVPKSSANVSAKDLLAMKARLSKKNWANAAWFVHPDLEEDFPLLNDGNGNLLYMPAGGISGAQYDTFLGRPIIYDEFMPAKGSYGEILLADFSQYLILKKGQERKDWSMHVEFLTDQQVFRIIMRVGGAPFKNHTYAVRHSSNRRGAFVALGTKPTATKSAKL